ncbi:hypothetical protein [Chamaesiphon sp.]|uniref:hypothetical protein n=1 Tax=Chamaesiphon sp. TaxID=2814140 RepID=UPI0035931FEA
MLKIWLTWLQPSLGLLGTALLLSEPFCTYAATKPSAIRHTGKTSTQSQWSNATIGTTIDKDLLTGIPATPDFAVRQLAINAMAKSGSLSASDATTLRQSNHNTLAGFISPSTRPQHLSAKATKLAKSRQVKNSISLALARAINPQTAIPVPGLFIGNSSDRVAKRILSTATGTRSIAATEIGAPTPLSAMMAKAAIGQSPRFANDPFPVVRPDTMQKLQQTPVTASATTKRAPYALNPIAAIPSVRPRAVASKSIVPKTTTTQHSLDPIAAIPSGLQRLLANNLNSQPIVASASVAKAISIKPRAVLALKQLASRTVTAPSISANSLQLATAQAYTSVPKFDIPGEKLVATKPMKSFVNLLFVKRSNLTTAAVTRKSNYTAIFTPTPRQSWTVVTQHHNLGGLILGSQPLSTMSKVVVSPAITRATSASAGLPARKLTNFN